MPKDRLITICTPNLWPVAFEFLATQSAYARARGYEHRIVTEPAWPNMHPSFSKVAAIKQALDDGCETVVWADADVAFLDEKWQIADLVGGKFFMAGLKQHNWPAWDYICCGLLVFRNGPEAHAYVDEWADMCVNGSPYTVPGTITKIDYKPWEQWYADELNRFKWGFQGIRPCTHHEIGAFSKQLWNDGVPFEPGMPTVHMAGDSPWSDRHQVLIDYYLPLIKREALHE